MDFDNAKENIQPLASGRNVSLLQASLSQDSTHGQELLAQRKQMEEEVRTYTGTDPLGAWYKFICWIEQSYPAGGSGSGLQTVLHQCLTKFEDDERYRQDKRLIKLFIKFMEKQKDKIEFYQQMYNNGIGTMLADFYIAWAYSYDLSGNMRKADEIFRLGLECRAEPLEDLKEAHQHFGYTVGQRMLYSTGEEANAVNQELNERRLALQSLHGRRQQISNSITVGSIRTGAAVKSGLPGVVQVEPSTTTSRRNVGRNVEVFNDENSEGNIPISTETEVKSSLRSIIDSACSQENIKEPVAWNKANAKRHKHGKIFGSNASPDLGFDIHVDEQAMPPITNYERRLDQPFRFPTNFVAKNRPQEPWVTPVTIEDEPNASGLPCYNKCLLYPRPNVEFSPEEYRAYSFLKHRNPQHPFVHRNDDWWGTGRVIRGIRCYPNFARFSKPQDLGELDKFWKPPLVAGLQVVFDKIYNEAEQKEYQPEELLAAKWMEKRNVTVHGDFDMEETVCLPGNKMPRRKSFFPSSSRKSIMPRRVSSVQEEDEKEEDEATLIVKDIPSQVPPKIPESPCDQKDEPKIKIFEDSDSPRDNFAVPAVPVPKIEIYEDTEEPQPTPKTRPFYDGDETCSTQMFNMFIKSQAVSTPKGTQKQAPSRQFGTVLKELPLPEEPAHSVESPVETRSPTLRKQLSTILETSEHGTQSLATSGASTKSTITSTSSPGSNAVSKLGSKIEENTPGQMRLQRVISAGASAVVSEPEKQGGDNFLRRELWEPNAPSVPMLKSLRFQEDKTETIPRPLACFQEDKTETLPQMPIALPENSMHNGSLGAENCFSAPQLPTLDDESDLCGLFGKTPPKTNIFGSPKRNFDPTSQLFKSTQGDRSSFAVTGNKLELQDSFMTDLSFVPETQPEALAKSRAIQKFDIFLDDTQPNCKLPKPVAVMGSSFALDCTLPETQQVSIKEPGTQQENIGQSHMIASFMKDCTEIGSCPSQIASTSNKIKYSNDTMSESSRKAPVNENFGISRQPDEFFELNAATEMFATNISMIKNSTLLPPNAMEAEASELSIYYKTTPLTPKQSHRSWSQSDFETPPRENFVHPTSNGDQTVLNETLADANKNPFNVELISSLLESIDFSMYIEKLPHCQLVGHVKRLHPNTSLEVHNEKFEVSKMIGKGAYGSVYVGKHLKSGKKVALKQERPTNYWEFYICLEIHSRLTSEQMISSYAHIDYALVGNNSSVYISEFSDYGSLIGVCNKVKSVTSRNLDEYVVMHLSCQMLDIVDHLHAMGIIHADIKPDNFLLMKPICADPNEVSLQLIDFGVSIDMKLFPDNQTFNYVHHDDLFKCIEMRTGRPWTYQLDLYGLVSVMHVLLFGRYMEVVQRAPSTIWMPKTNVPRYFQRTMWENIFRTLLNIRDCRTMPNLQQLRTQLKCALAEKEKYVGEAINKFNTILQK
ncbi:uncharacterized protein LOC6733180 [Drosophila simulans]|uniref:GD10345 n=1 Tax=Drosophila simulans TaxID=7240 RepID=B4QCQ2_DROSI|nr:uncharacterized protein LOC6733180 [Drosophila simulans]EDX05841.1 GD10345 [Drosophila simulans]KMY91670.1 uncharacterized protein Dsimw501_GD10345 [Drosophila simulans]